MSRNPSPGANLQRGLPVLTILLLVSSLHEPPARGATPTDLEAILKPQQSYASNIHSIKFSDKQTDTTYVDPRTLQPLTTLVKMAHDEQTAMEISNGSSAQFVRRMSWVKHYPGGALNPSLKDKIDNIEIYDGKRDYVVSGQAFYGAAFNGKYHRDGSVATLPPNTIPDNPLEGYVIGSQWVSDMIGTGSVSVIGTVKDDRFGQLVEVNFKPSNPTVSEVNGSTLFFAPKYDYMLIKMLSSRTFPGNQQTVSTFEIGDVVSVGNRWLAKSLIRKKELVKNGQTTLLTTNEAHFSAIAINAQLNDDLFTPTWSTADRLFNNDENKDYVRDPDGKWIYSPDAPKNNPAESGASAADPTSQAKQRAFRIGVLFIVALGLLGAIVWRYRSLRQLS